MYASCGAKQRNTAFFWCSGAPVVPVFNSSVKLCQCATHPKLPPISKAMMKLLLLFFVTFLRSSLPEFVPPWFCQNPPTWVKRSDSNMFFLPLAPGRWDVSFRYEFRRGSHERSECVDKSLDLQFRAQPPQSSANHWVASLFSIWYKYKDYFLTLIIHYTLQVNLLSLCHLVCPPETWFDPPKYQLMDLLFTYTG